MRPHRVAIVFEDSSAPLEWRADTESAPREVHGESCRNAFGLPLFLWGGWDVAGWGEAGYRDAVAQAQAQAPGSVLSEGTPLSGLTEDRVDPPTTLAADDAFEDAGLGAADLDVVECQDTDAARELLSYEELGLCPRGDAAKLLEDGATELGGRLPVNVSGGLLSKGEPLGASALGQLVELTRQLRGGAGPRQVDGAGVGLAHTVGRGANASVVILKR